MDFSSVGTDEFRASLLLIGVLLIQRHGQYVHTRAYVRACVYTYKREICEWWATWRQSKVEEERQFWVPRPYSPVSSRRVVALTLLRSEHRTRAQHKIFAQISSPLHLSVSLSLVHFHSLFLFLSRTHTTRPIRVKGLCIATGPGNISFRKITGSWRGCQCIKQTSLRLPYT